MAGLGEAWLSPTDDGGNTSLNPSLHCLLETALSDGGKNITGLPLAMVLSDHDLPSSPSPLLHRAAKNTGAPQCWC